MALEGWILVAFIIFVVLFVIKIINKKQAMAVKVVLFLFVVLMVSASYVFLSSDVDFKSFDGAVNAVKLYFSWLGVVVDNVSKVSSYVVRQDWGVDATNSTNLSES